MIGAMATPGAARRPSRAAGGAIALVLAILVSGCSDAYTADEKAEAEVPADSKYLLVSAAPAVAPVMEELVTAYQAENPLASLIVVPENPAAADGFVSGREPAVWVAATADQQPFADSERVAVPPATFGSDELLTITPKGNPDGIDSLDVFAKGRKPGPTALCVEEVPCGSDARAMLREMGIDPVPEYTTKTGDALRAAVSAGSIAAGIVYRTDLVQPIDDIDVLTDLDTGDAGQVDYSILAFSDNPQVEDFVEWVTTSTTARDLLVGRGLLSPPAAP